MLTTHYCVLFLILTVSKKKNCSYSSSLLACFSEALRTGRVSILLLLNSTPPHELLLLLYLTVQMYRASSAILEISQSSFPSKPTQSSVSLCLRIWSHHFGDVWEAVRSSLPTSFPATDKLVIQPYMGFSFAQFTKAHVHHPTKQICLKEM